jgi:peroxiredoxin
MSLVGKTAPEFTLLDTTRQPVTLSGLRGSKVVLAFFPAAFSGVCEKELCTFRDSITELDGLNAKVIGISVDSPSANGGFAAKHGLGFVLLSDYARRAVVDYGVAHDDFAGMLGYTAAKRSVFIVSEDGTVTYEWVAPNPGVEPDYAAVKAALA